MTCFGIGKNNESGNVLIQVLILSGISMIFFVAMLSIQISQQRENEALTEKVAAIDFQRVISQIISNVRTCTELLNAGNITGGVTKLTFNPTTLPYSLKLEKVAEISVGGQVSAWTSNLTVLANNGTENGFQIEISSVALGNNTAQGNLRVKFDNAKLVRAISDLNLPISLAITPVSATAVKIDSCNVGLCPADQFMVGLNLDGSANCVVCNVRNNRLICP